MGYCSDVRILIEKRNFNKLRKQAKEKFPNGYMDCLDIKEERIGKAADKEIKYTYFGWNGVKFYDEEAEWIEQFAKNLKEFHYVRIGESWDDIDEYYNLNNAVDCIQVIRRFDDYVIEEVKL
jgi:hypothetical protein